ncbi:hypothetical protein [Azospirillum canadense]|uniref:hypothetical protein n=1 Tax=Azospirillum canadense TaxID=403962 RepID=UPI002226BC35|nr:hypothetical protein [Azospirillum canadense]MCW2239688.1 hypothetical protein [Azospirillum canadense]
MEKSIDVHGQWRSPLSPQQAEAELPLYEDAERLRADPAGMRGKHFFIQSDEHSRVFELFAMNSSMAQRQSVICRIMDDSAVGDLDEMDVPRFRHGSAR